MLAGFVLLTAIAASIGVALIWIARKLPQNSQSPLELANALLPQSQCGQCGYPGCRPYAEAIIDGTADINRCAPGGDTLVTSLAHLLGRSTKTVDPAYGIPTAAAVARIDENACIGCAICLAACPVDAIIGAAGFSHTVISAECTGCDLCVAPCPVDCISLEPLQPDAFSPDIAH